MTSLTHNGQMQGIELLNNNAFIPILVKTPTKKQIYKVLYCESCISYIIVPISFLGIILCEHGIFTTGYIEQLVDVFEF
ncbi:MAG: hypothetical protein AABY22_25115 [Nanoarchaeota archaeon]